VLQHETNTHAESTLDRFVSFIASLSFTGIAEATAIDSSCVLANLSC